MKRFVQTLTVSALALGVMALSASAQIQNLGAFSIHKLKNATPIVKQAACNGTTGHCDCGPGWISACGDRCCHCIPCN